MWVIVIMWYIQIFNPRFKDASTAIIFLHVFCINIFHSTKTSKSEKLVTFFTKADLELFNLAENP